MIKIGDRYFDKTNVLSDGCTHMEEISKPTSVIEFPVSQIEAVKEMLRYFPNCRKIPVIKVIRALTGQDLITSKRMYEIAELW